MFAANIIQFSTQKAICTNLAGSYWKLLLSLRCSKCTLGKEAHADKVAGELRLKMSP